MEEKCGACQHGFPEHCTCKTTEISKSAAMPGSKDFEQLYHDLIYCVCNKIPGETRHETAKRILTQHENQTHGSCKSL